MIYKDAEIYLTECTHPDYDFLRYLGLDTKKDPNYIGSSVVLKWFVNLLGKSHFKKTVLETVTGDMTSLCEVEQRYIKEHNAVANPNYLNMNGGRTLRSSQDLPMSFDFVIETIDNAATFISKLNVVCSNHLNHCTFAKQQFITRILNMAVYGYLKYEQEDFEYCLYSRYGLHSDNDVEEVFNAVVAAGLIEKNSGLFSITEQLIDLIPAYVTSKSFSTKLGTNY